ncbi:mariner mos1 transposase [Lasius niger]|uniref:Mariner mos1 transposase n=1 Tax=Lasius niger TaxID=67767 RepID=A0A0J7KRE2_LASNI|nr:mariner mos1 transposase [Lasius niger]
MAQPQLAALPQNPPAHNALKTQQFLAINNMSIVPHPPYLPNLIPCDFFLFPKMKLKLKGRRFKTIQEKLNRTESFTRYSKRISRERLKHGKSAGVTV